MKFCESKIPGVFEVHVAPSCDDRGFFARSWSQREFEQRGLNPRDTEIIC
jgi:dTDP-4-dehydrorhamnose 3,5-epimerase-like enzyme